MISEETKTVNDKKRKSERKGSSTMPNNKEYFFPKYLTSKNLFQLEVKI